MHILGPDTERCLARSRLRRRAMILLSSLGEAYPRQLAKAVGIDCGRLKELMHGRPPRYSVEDALITAGLAVERTDVFQRRYYAITSRGRRKARSLTKRSARRRAVDRVA
jgi:predicted transcriptional regulator with HTH domain